MSKPDPPVRPTLAARLRWALTERFGENHYSAAGEGLDAETIEAVVECVLAALTPEPVTPPPSVPAIQWAEKNRRAYPTSDPTLIPTEPRPPVFHPSAPSTSSVTLSRDDDGRGLAVDMIDVDRLRHLANGHLSTRDERDSLRDIAARLATTITETLSLRAEVQADDVLLANYRRTIACIPPCSQHGDDCLPHAEDWIQCRQKDEAELVSLRQSLREAIERCREQVKRTDAAEEELATCCLCEYEFDEPHTVNDRGRQVVCAKCWPHDADARGWQQRAEKAEQERDALRTALETLANDFMSEARGFREAAADDDRNDRWVMAGERENAAYRMRGALKRAEARR